MPESGASELISSIMTAVSNCSLYSREHPLVTEFSERAVRIVEGLFKDDTLNITILGDTILINNEPLRDTGTHIVNFIKKMKKKGIERLVIKRGIDAGEFKNFIVNLSSYERPLSSSHLAVGTVEVRFKGEGVDISSLINENVEKVRRSLGIHDVIKLMMENAGTDFNPLLVENFVDGLKRIHAF